MVEQRGKNERIRNNNESIATIKFPGLKKDTLKLKRAAHTPGKTIERNLKL